MRAFLNLRYTSDKRATLFRRGLKRLGYSIHQGLCMDPGQRDIFVTWNRIMQGHQVARLFESRGLPVLVAENASWGNTFAGDDWYHIARNRHNTAGLFDVGGPERWDSLGVELMPWRESGEAVILPQRGIGSPPTAMPRSWPAQARAATGARIRKHPGTAKAKCLEEDLRNCGRVITWGSGAAIKALMWGIPVESHMSGWIGQQDNTDAGRLAMLRRLAWAQWRLSEIESGEAFARLLER